MIRVQISYKEDVFVNIDYIISITDYDKSKNTCYINLSNDEYSLKAFGTADGYAEMVREAREARK